MAGKSTKSSGEKGGESGGKKLGIVPMKYRLGVFELLSSGLTKVYMVGGFCGLVQVFGLGGFCGARIRGKIFLYKD